MAVYPAISAAVWNYRAVSPRRVQPFILAAIHITDNYGLASALQEANYSNRLGSGASFHFVTNRNGSTVQCADPVSQVAWTNGSWLNPNWSLSTVTKAVTQGYGANDSTFMTIEHVGCEPIGYPITNEQVESTAKLIAWGSRLSGIPVNRTTVLGHRDYDSVNRLYCPTRYNLETLLGRIITRANQILAPAPPPAVIPRADGAPMRFRSISQTMMTLKPGKPIRDGASVSASVIATSGTSTRVRVIGYLNTGYLDPWYIYPVYRGNGDSFAYSPRIDFT